MILVPQLYVPSDSVPELGLQGAPVALLKPPDPSHLSQAPLQALFVFVPQLLSMSPHLCVLKVVLLVHAPPRAKAKWEFSSSVRAPATTMPNATAVVTAKPNRFISCPFQ